MSQCSEFARTSTPTLLDQSGAAVVSLSQLESSLSVVSKSRAGLPELRVAQDQTHEMSGASFLQSDGEASSSANEPPPLPGGIGQPKASGGHSDNNQTVESASQLDYPLLYATMPFGSEPASGGGEDSGSEIHDPGQPDTSRPDQQPQGEILRDLSGRSRATLKQYFETEDPYTFPIGQRVVAFTEPLLPSAPGSD